MPTDVDCKHAVLVSERPSHLVILMCASADVVEQHNGRGRLVAPLDVLQHDARGQQHGAFRPASSRPVVMSEEFAVVCDYSKVLTELEVSVGGDLDHALIVKVATSRTTDESPHASEEREAMAGTGYVRGLGRTGLDRLRKY